MLREGGRKRRRRKKKKQKPFLPLGAPRGADSERRGERNSLSAGSALVAFAG